MDSKPPGRLLVIEHEEDSGGELLGEAAVAKGFRLHVVTPNSGIPTSCAGYDAVIMLGSADSVYDPAIADWFVPEIELLREADAIGVPVFGVCFGAQALAVALGGSVARAACPEIGWVEVDSTDIHVIPAGPWFEWHVDTITPPDGAEVLATTKLANGELCVQAYRVGPHLAVQFHPEAQLRQATDWPAADPVNLAATGQTPEWILQRTIEELPAARVRAADLLDRFLEQAGDGTGSDRYAPRARPTPRARPERGARC